MKFGMETYGVMAEVEKLMLGLKFLLTGQTFI